MKFAFFVSDTGNEILLSVTLNLVKPIPSLLSGKYFIGMNEHYSSSAMTLSEEAHLEGHFIPFFYLYLFHLSNFLPTSFHLFILVSLFLSSIPLI